MQTEITSNIEIKESKGLTLTRVRVEETKIERDQIPGKEYPSGIMITD